MDYNTAHHICQLGIKNQRLLSRAIDLGQISTAYELKCYDTYLWNIYHKAIFDFIAQIANGTTLLIGEGNLSFSLSLTRKNRITPRNLTSTTFEKSNDLSDEAEHNAKGLKQIGVVVIHGVDVSRLTSIFGNKKFDTIIFQFPHTGSREPIEGHNPNHVLLRKFLKSAKSQLKQNGKVLVTTVDNPHYRGAFQFDLAAGKAGFKPPESYPFDPSLFPEYSHSMTNENDSAIDGHDSFSTWIFKQ